jgi:FAD:protein FMN transferase
VSITVVGDNICDVDLVATAAFAMGDRGVRFIEDMPGFEAYAINKNGMATMTSGFQHYVS